MTPFAMMLRPGDAARSAAVAGVLSVALLLATTASLVWAAGRIFRIGLLMQGKPPNLPEL